MHSKKLFRCFQFKLKPPQFNPEFLSFELHGFYHLWSVSLDIIRSSCMLSPGQYNFLPFGESLLSCFISLNRWQNHHLLLLVSVNTSEKSIKMSSKAKSLCTHMLWLQFKLWTIIWRFRWPHGAQRLSSTVSFDNLVWKCLML